tara:strand:+ start:3188 stop:4435 length:1248 start_codon:yes stop_codon:yes gene_type:complete
MHTSYFVIVDLVIKSFTFLLIPIYAFLLNPIEMGIYAEWFSFYTLVFAISIFGVNSFIVVLKSKGIKDVNVEPVFIRFLAKWWLLLFGVVSLINALGFTFVLDYTLILLPIAAFSFSIIDYSTVKLRLEKSIKLYAGAQILTLLLVHLFPVVLTFFVPSAETRIFAFTFSLICTSLLFIIIFKQIKFTSRSYSKGIKSPQISNNRIFRYGFPFIILAIGQWFKAGFDLQLIKLNVGYEIVGSLGIVLQVSAVVLIASAIFNRIYSINLYDMIAKNEIKNWFFLIFKLSVITVLGSLAALFFGVFVFTKLITGYEYIEALMYPVMLSAAMYSIANYVSSVLFYYEKTALFTILNIFSALLHVFTSLYIISLIGPQYIGYSALVSNLVFMVSVILIAWLVQTNQSNQKCENQSPASH